MRESGVQHDYTDLDTWWQHYSGCYAERTWRDYRHLLAEAILDAEGPPILDVGCGIGFLVECARRFGIPAVGLEGSGRALEIARTKHPQADVRYWIGGSPLPLETGSVGVAVLNEFVDHITREQNELLFTELHRVVRPGGLLLVKSPSRFNKYDSDLGHVTFFSPSEFRCFVESFSFKVVRQPYTAQPLLGTGSGAQLVLRAVSLVFRPERWASRIDLVARRP